MLDNLPIESFLASHNLAAEFRDGADRVWDECFDDLPYKAFAYDSSSLAYQLAYQQGHGGSWRDISLILLHDNKPAALWPLTLSLREGNHSLTSQGLPVLPPTFAKAVSSVTKKNLTGKCLNLAEQISCHLGIASWQSQESFNDALGLGDWHIQALGRGATAELRYDLFLDLRRSLEEIKAGFRKSYKSLVNSGARLWKIGIFENGGDDRSWREFHELHLQVAGRATRSDETWNMQCKQIIDGKAFLVWLRDAGDRMVGAGFFNFTSDEAVYSVAAYDRELFDKPLGHVVQYRAIDEMKKRGIRWYKIGVRPYPSDKPEPAPKEVSIGRFKEGFASHVFPSFRLNHPTNGVAKSA